MEEFKILLSQCNYLDIISPQKNMTLVHVACSYGHLDILKILLEPSSEILNQQDVEGWSPAHCASAEGHLNVLRLLGKYGPLIGDNLWEFHADYPIDLDLKTYEGESIEDVSLPENQDQVAKILNGIYQYIQDVDLRLLQTFASTVDPEHRSLNSLDNILSVTDCADFQDACLSATCSNKDILGSIAEALNISSESIFASPQLLNQHTVTQNPSIIHNISNFRY
jgi:ankyrin repeat protein